MVEQTLQSMDSAASQRKGGMNCSVALNTRSTSALHVSRRRRKVLPYIMLCAFGTLLCLFRCGIFGQTFMVGPRLAERRFSLAPRAATPAESDAPATSPAAAAETSIKDKPPPSPVGGIAEVAPEEKGPSMAQFMGLEPVDGQEDAVAEWSESGLTPEEERKKFTALWTGSLTFILTGGYIFLQLFMDNTDWAGFEGEKTLSAKDMAALEQSTSSSSEPKSTPRGI
eukprot:TRINITY_DN54264_c0_g1_i1.p1 TRINITY_DN54264_c0_g1~~TRINITY_DN54264_c0_g1_i1.p1  ORF type:complete len:226 (-),score=50.30 TRINITY_DN54264_c0_g1_i1:52-729(-)